MRFLLMLLVALGFSLTFLNCEDKQTSKKTQNTVIKDSTEITTKTKAKKKNERKYPKLTDENAMEFFLEYEKENPEDMVRITTDFGVIDIKLYDKTKFHRANFIYLTKLKYFHGTQFYRVVKDFVIQGGSSDDYNIMTRRKNIGHYLLPPDTKRGYTHKRGAISMPSSEIENAYKLASPYQFFIVQSPNGAAYLDGDYTVFGEVISGMDVVDEIAQVKTDDGEWPLQNVYIRKIELIE
ncbi:cyclophilin family peptidyl-prolyl cis-trans isomerase [Winogradskyella epiphytica]|uniref:Peptidyl-prolyl cis-trans isomerase n=1 Tax=Winogradskyella epiphytica TaxID=262005 RepID=A0A2V4YEW3_9FLAO|nr:peptidylprolyl isomerase [Winogradskyella epiphytica]PYE82027.1 cyclophilin family peptidyl-prolyl cis-trans isomerase [Winogradskyella epiphytica]